MQKESNIGQVLVNAQAMGLPLVGIISQHFSNTNKKMILSFAWQLMRKHSMTILEEVKVTVGSTEEDILTWANTKILVINKDYVLARFNDKKVRTSLPLFALLQSINARIINYEHIERGTQTEESL